ncbi:MAG TPA: hypothetical protein VFB32_02110 [Rudaea sp.]|nr:hypothetical protein [Rudaea sp.]
MSMSALWTVIAAAGLAGSPAGLRTLPMGIPSAHAPLQWGAAVLETLQSSPRLEAIRAEDVAGANTVAVPGVHAIAVAPARGKLEATYTTPAQALTPFVRREIEHVWRLSVPATATGAAMHVTATVESLRGEPGKLTLLGHDEVSIPVLVLENAPTLRTDGTGTRVIEGGVVLQIPNGALTHAGQYGGRIILRTEGY